MNKIKLFTIGFTKTSAEDFFNRIKNAGVKKIIDVRLNNNSQLAGFTKKNDLEYFLRELGGIEYQHLPLLAPTKEILSEYRKQKSGWETYEKKFVRLIRERKIEEKISPALLHKSCLLCSEDTPDYCHRRLIAEYLSEKWTKTMNVTHL